MFVSVHYVDNVYNVKTNRGGFTGHIYCLSHFLAWKIIIQTNTFYTFMQFSSILYYMCFFIVHIVTVFFRMQINKWNKYSVPAGMHYLRTAAKSQTCSTLSYILEMTRDVLEQNSLWNIRTHGS